MTKVIIWLNHLSRDDQTIPLSDEELINQIDLLRPRVEYS